jgi:hypothetical protein
MKNSTDWQRKNQLRKEAKSADPRAYREGRRNRRMFANNGAFGHWSGRTFNWCALGTSTTRKDKEEE